MASVEQNVTRTRRTSFPGGVSSYGEDRVCREAGCGTHLSRYNDQPTCGAHAPGRKAS